MKYSINEKFIRAVSNNDYYLVVKLIKLGANVNVYDGYAFNLCEKYGLSNILSVIEHKKQMEVSDAK